MSDSLFGSNTVMDNFGVDDSQIPPNIDIFDINNIGTTEENIEEVTPLSITNFKPLEDNAVLCQISPAKFDSLLKVLNVLISDKSSNESIVIKQSSITQSVNGAIISCNVLDIFDDKKIDLQIINPKKYLKLFKMFKNNNDIFILDDSDNARFIVTNGEIKLFLPKQIESLVEEIKLPDLGNFAGVCATKVDKTTRNIITGLASDANYIDFLVQDNSLKGIHIPDTAIYLFNEFINDPKSAKLDETNADLALRSVIYFSIPAEDYDINIGVDNSDGSYLLVTTCNTGFIKVTIFEPLEIVTGGNILI